LFQTLDDVEVIGETEEIQMALTLCAVYHPDVVLMDLLMTSVDGVTATHLIRDKFPNIAVVILTSSVDPAHIDSAFRAGAISYIRKDGTIHEVARAVREAYKGNATLSAEVTKIVISNLHKREKIGDNLTAREYEVLALMVEGLNTRAIAERLFISPSTVKNHITGIFSKLHTKNRAKTVAFALQHKLLEKP